MKYIDAEKIQEYLVAAQKISPSKIDGILEKSCGLKRLSMAEVAVLLSADDPASIAKIFKAASLVKNKVYGARVVLFAPLYISNRCANSCLYCAFQAENQKIERRHLSVDQIRQETRCLLSRGHKRILMVTGETSAQTIDYYVEALKAVYESSFGVHRVRRVNVNCAPLTVREFRRLKKAGIGTYQLFQETYHEPTYRAVHPKGPKSDPDNRISGIDRAFEAGIDDVGIGVLFGLYDYRFEVLALLSHIEALEKKFRVGPHTISVPRMEPAVGVDIGKINAWRLTDRAFKKTVAILRLAVPYTGLILSTRETPQMRDQLFGLGISQISAESRTAPGGYTASRDPFEADTQFILNDRRTLDQVMASLIEKGCIPSFCTACYRNGRTGEVFMDLARPGTIKGKCQMNALITLKEYLDDFAQEPLRKKGYRLIRRLKHDLDASSRTQLEHFYGHIAKGGRDVYV